MFESCVVSTPYTLFHPFVGMILEAEKRGIDVLLSIQNTRGRMARTYPRMFKSHSSYITALRFTRQSGVE